MITVWSASATATEFTDLLLIATRLVDRHREVVDAGQVETDRGHRLAVRQGGRVLFVEFVVAQAVGLFDGSSGVVFHGVGVPDAARRTRT